MFHLLDEAIEAHLRKEVPLDKSIEVSFVLPDREWSTGLTKPTVNCYLWDIKRDDKRSVGGVELVGNGADKTRRLVLPRIRASYFVSVWTGDLRDEHTLLGRMVQGIMRTRRLDPAVVPKGLTAPNAIIETVIGVGEGRIARDFWTSVDGRYRPGLDLQIVLPVETGLGTEAGPPTYGIDIRTTDRNQPTRQSFRGRAYVEEIPPRPERSRKSPPPTDTVVEEVERVEEVEEVEEVEQLVTIDGATDNDVIDDVIDDEPDDEPGEGA